MRPFFIENARTRTGKAPVLTRLPSNEVVSQLCFNRYAVLLSSRQIKTKLDDALFENSRTISGIDIYFHMSGKSQSYRFRNANLVTSELPGFCWQHSNRHHSL
jgi:hypothetical protein